MFDFDKLNQTAQSHQDLAQKEAERNKELLKKQEEIESQELIEYLCAYLSPFVERLANDVISRNGKKRETWVHINDIIFGYKQTPYILQNHKSQYEVPMYNFVRHVIYRVREEFQKKLTAFEMDMQPGRNSGFFRADHYIHIVMEYKQR